MRKLSTGIIIASVIIFVSTFSVMSDNAFARTDRCGKNGCTRDNTPNGTVFCDYHAAEYVKEQGYTPCKEYGCYKRVYSGHKYCTIHECQDRNCSARKQGDSNYCKDHQPRTSTSKSSSGSKYSTGKSYSGSSKSSTSKSGSSKSSSGKSTTKKKYDPYDVYNYKSAQDFADDKYEEFFDYEDDYEDEDEAYDAAEDYWRAHHKK